MDWWRWGGSEKEAPTLERLRSIEIYGFCDETCTWHNMYSVPSSGTLRVQAVVQRLQYTVHVTASVLITKAAAADQSKT